MEQRLVFQQGLMRRTTFATCRASVHEHVGKVLGLHMVPHVGSGLVRKL